MDKIKSILEASIHTKQLILQDSGLLTAIQQAVDVMTDAFQQGRHVYFCGNGGSAADAQHLAAEFSGRFYSNRKALPSEALHTNTSYLTAVANDYGYDHVYSRMIDGIGKPGDVLVGISTSGNSINIVRALESAKKNKMKTIALTGAAGGKVANLADLSIKVPSDDTPRIQESHITIGHIICQLVEEKIFQ